MEPVLSDPPIDEVKPRPPGWFAVWSKLLSRPAEQTVLEIIEHPDAKQNTAFIWVFFAGCLSGIILGLAQAILVATGWERQVFDNNVDDLNGLVSGISVFATFLLCVSPIAGALAVVIFGLGVGGVQWFARVLGGTGSYEKLAYILGVISVPCWIISPIAVILTLVFIFVNTPLMWLIGTVEFLVVIYMLVLQVFAVKAVDHLWWSEAIGVTLVSGLGISGLFGCCLFFGIFGAA
jgi:hypothetical protein